MYSNGLFLERCDQVAILLESHKEIELLDLSALLRQLLFDEKSLVDTVNTRPIRLEFRVGAWPPMFDPLPTHVSLEDELDPETGPPGISTAITLSRAEFARYPVTYFDGLSISVKDVIRYASNVAGGVHHDPSPRPEFRIMHALSQQIGWGGLPLGIRQLKAIGRVTLRALYPLIDDVKKRP